jgi:putative phosphoribosyl transferase
MPTSKPKINPSQRDVAIVTPDATLDGHLGVPADAVGLVLFAHGSGSSRHSPRNHYVARVLQDAKIATLLFDLLTSEEGERDAIDRSLRFDIEWLSSRVIGAIDWVSEQAEIGELPLGLFGASTGAAAALVAAVARSQRVAAVVSRGGRPDLAKDVLDQVRAATLLIVGGHDPEVLALNQLARQRMPGPVELSIVAGATHLFEQPGALEQVASRAATFFRARFDAAGSAADRPSPSDSNRTDRS